MDAPTSTSKNLVYVNLGIAFLNFIIFKIVANIIDM